MSAEGIPSDWLFYWWDTTGMSLYVFNGGSSGSMVWSKLNNDISAQAHINDASTNAETNAPTNLNTLTTVLSVLTGEVNSTNAKQNDLATKYNDLATKFNTLMDHLEAQGLQLTS